MLNRPRAMSLLALAAAAAYAYPLVPPGGWPLTVSPGRSGAARIKRAAKRKSGVAKARRAARKARHA